MKKKKGSVSGPILGNFFQFQGDFNLRQKSCFHDFCRNRESKICEVNSDPFEIGVKLPKLGPEMEPFSFS